jgi:fumarylacetoacetate (FAA) hydrolase family protein
MKTVNGNTLYQSASSKLTAEKTALGAKLANASDLQTTMASEAADRHQKDLKATVGEILNLKANKEEFLANLATRNVSLQAEIDNNRAVAAKANRADAYGDSTDNYLPLLKVLEGRTPTDDKSLNAVPDGWEAATPAAVA